jgi:hypothetical protein
VLGCGPCRAGRAAGRNHRERSDEVQRAGDHGQARRAAARPPQIRRHAAQDGNGAQLRPVGEGDGSHGVHERSRDRGATGYIPAQFKAKILASTGLVGPGETVDVTFKAPAAPGQYTYLCSFPGHFIAGMKGVLTVK